MMGDSMFILVSEYEGSEPTEVGIEMNGMVFLPSISAVYPGTTTLKYRNPATNTFRLVKCINGVLHPPQEGWFGVQYVCVKPQGDDGMGGKRKFQEEGSMVGNKKMGWDNGFGGGWGQGAQGGGFGAGGNGGFANNQGFGNFGGGAQGGFSGGPQGGFGGGNPGSGAPPPFKYTGFASTGAPPNEGLVNELLNRTGYPLERGAGERHYGPPPNHTEGSPGDGCEVFIGNLPMDMYEDSLIPVFEEFGTIYEMRLKMDPSTGMGRGFCFVSYTNQKSAKICVSRLKWYEITPNHFLKVNIQIQNSRIFVGNIPKDKVKEALEEKFEKATKSLKELIFYEDLSGKGGNRGFCFLEYENHKAASDAKRKLTGQVIWNRELQVSWADTQAEPDSAKMEKVKTLYVKNLTTEVTEDVLKENFEPFGELEKVKKVKDFAFITYNERAHALAAIEGMHGENLMGKELDVTLAKPVEQNERTRNIQKKEERKMMFRGMPRNGGMGMGGGGGFGRGYGMGGPGGFRSGGGGFGMGGRGGGRGMGGGGFGRGRGGQRGGKRGGWS